MLDWIIEGLRWILWGLTSAFLELMDICYDIVTQIATADFLNDNQVWQWYYTFMLFLGVLIITRSLSMFFKFAFDEEFREKLNGSHFINKLITISLVIALLPTCLGFISQLSSWGIKNISMIVGTQASDKPSTMIITAFMNTDNGEYDANGNWISGNKVTYTIEDIDINAEGEGDKDYKFFNDIADIFIISFVGIAAAIMLIINGIQIGKRSYSIVMKFIIAPIPISSLIVPGDETFTMWRKMIISDYLLNYVQTLMIMIIMILSGSKIIQNFSVWVQIISFIAGLLLLLSGIPELARIVGGDTSQASVLQQVASFRMATRGVGHGIASTAGSALGAIGGGVKTMGALGMFGIGRAVGGESISNIKENIAKNGGDSSNGFMGGSSKNGEANGSFHSASTKKRNPASFNEPSTARQRKAGEHFNIPGVDNMSKGEASLALEKAGADRSYWHDQGTGENIGSNGGDFTNFDSTTVGSNGNDSASFGSASVESNGNDSISSGPGPSADNSSSNSNKNIFSRPNSRADRFAKKANEMNGLQGASAKLATNVSRHLYSASAQRLQQTRVYRTGNYVKRVSNDLIGGNQKNDTTSTEKL